MGKTWKSVNKPTRYTLSVYRYKLHNTAIPKKDSLILVKANDDKIR